MHRACTYLKNLIGPNKLFKTQSELAEKSFRTPSSLNGTLKAQQIEPDTLKAILGALPIQKQRELLQNVVMDAIPQDYWKMVFSGDQAVLQQFSHPQVGRSVETLFNYLLLKASTEKKVHRMLETMAEMLGLPRSSARSQVPISTSHKVAHA